jgi:hypothetical protein
MLCAHVVQFLIHVLVVYLPCVGQNQVADYMGPGPDDLRAMVLSGHSSTRCIVQAVLQSFFNLSSVLWTTCIATTLFSSLLRRKPIDDIAVSYFPWYVVVSNGVPAVLTIIPGAMKAYGAAGAW